MAFIFYNNRLIMSGKYDDNSINVFYYQGNRYAPRGFETHLNYVNFYDDTDLEEFSMIPKNLTVTDTVINTADSDNYAYIERDSNYANVYSRATNIYFNGNIDSLFEKCSNLKQLNARDLAYDYVETMNRSFFNCTGLDFEPIPRENLSKAVSMYSTYANCTNLHGNPQVSDSVENIAFVYFNCVNLSGQPEIPANVVDASYAYFSDTNLNGIPVSSDKLINMSSTYYDCHNLTGNPVASNVVDNMYRAYFNCTNISGNPVIGDNTTNMQRAYYNCVNLTGQPVCSDDTTDMLYTYSNCVSLNGVPVCGNNVIDMTATYENCVNLTGEPKCSNTVVNMQRAYLNCVNISGDIIIGTNVERLTETFKDCHNLDGNVYIYGNKILDMSNCFVNCDNIKESSVYLSKNTPMDNSSYAYSCLINGATGIVFNKNKIFNTL